MTGGLGSTANLCDQTGAVLVSYTYDAFGAVRSQSAASDNYWLFAGEQRDEESGLATCGRGTTTRRRGGS
jgi:hypothetical protein